MFWGIFKDFILQQNAQGTSNLTPMFPLQARVSIFFCNISLGYKVCKQTQNVY